MAELPFSIICDILSRLPTKDLERYRCVCRSWYDLPIDPYFIHLRFGRRHSQRLLGLLLHSPTTHTLYFTTSSECKTIKIPHGHHQISSIIASCNGLLLVRESSQHGPLVVYNPFTKDRFTLPELQNSIHSPEYYGFGFDKHNNKYKVIAVYDAHRPFLDIITLGESSWRSLPFFDDEPYINLPKPAFFLFFFDGAFRWPLLTHREGKGGHLRGFLTLDIISEKFGTIRFSPHLELNTSSGRNKVVIVGDHNSHFQAPAADTDGSYQAIDPNGCELLTALNKYSFLSDKYSSKKSLSLPLVIHDLENHQITILRIDGAPEYDRFEMYIFEPSFISPII